MRLQHLFRRLPSQLRRHKVVQTVLRLYPAGRVQEMEFNGGARLYADLRDANARVYFLRATYEPEFFRIAGPFLSEDATYFDVGANFGFCTFGLLADRRLRRVKCHLFEANRELCGLLRRSAALHPEHEIVINHGCVTERRGISHLTITDDWGGSYIGGDGGHAVANIRLDDYCRQHGISRVDLAKIDIEGHEPAALRGAEEVLRHGVFRAIYLEMSAATLERQGHTAADLGEILKTAGYRIFYCKPDDIRARPTERRVIDVDGQPLSLVECSDLAFPDDIQTDLLAIHPSRPITDYLGR